MTYFVVDALLAHIVATIAFFSDVVVHGDFCFGLHYFVAAFLSHLAIDSNDVRLASLSL